VLLSDKPVNASELDHQCDSATCTQHCRDPLPPALQ